MKNHGIMFFNVKFNIKYLWIRVKERQQTPYHCEGTMQWSPPEWDETFGRVWDANQRS